VSQVDAVADTTTIGASRSARLPYAGCKDGAGVSQTARAEPSFGVTADRIRDRRSERGGSVNVVGARGDTAQQRASIAMTATTAPFSYYPTPAAGGRDGVERESASLPKGITRDIAWALERHEISPFLIDGKQDGDLDRHYSSPVDILREITANREHWLLRCIETLEPDANGERDTEDNRARAAVLLEAFEREVEHLGKTSKYCHYNVNYSMRGDASKWIDGYRGLAQLAGQRGDVEGARRANEAIDDILLMRGTWRPLMLIVRERAQDSTTIGWRNLLRWQRTAAVDGQRTAAQFPPP